MYLQLKLTSQNQTKIILLITVPIIVSGLFFVTINSSCDVKHVSLLDQIKEYETDFDPDQCYLLLEDINSFNDQCEFELEPIDCG